MNIKNTSLILSLSFLFITIKSMDFKEIKFHASYKLGNIGLLHNGQDFYIKKDNNLFKVERHCLDLVLRKINFQQLDLFQKEGYVSITQLSNGEYSLKSNVKGVGGGVMLANGFYWLTKAIGYGVPITLATTAIVSTLPASGGAGLVSGLTAGTSTAIKGAGSIAVKTAIGKAAIGGTTASTLGANVLSQTIIGTAGATASTEAVTTVAAATSTSGGYCAFVETVALTVWAWALTLPTP